MRQADRFGAKPPYAGPRIPAKDRMKYDLDQPFLQTNEALKALQDGGDFTGLMVMREELKTLPFGEVWDEYGEFLFDSLS